MKTTIFHYAGIAFWMLGALGLYVVYTGSAPTAITIGDIDAKKSQKNVGKMCATVFTLILLCTLPIGIMNPGWDGERAASIVRQYEVMAESILDGRINLDYGDMDPKLLEMDNPYDPQAREELGVKYHWDHSFYNGKYYMYFGIVPVLILFLPYRILTGEALPTCHATQIFIALFVIGFFLFLYNLAKHFFPKMHIAVFLLLYASLSIMSVWYIIDTPGMYCVAIISGMCMEIWSLYFFFYAVLKSKSDRQFLLFGFLGSLFGALAFGCRPTIALANLLAIPLFLYHADRQTGKQKLLCQQLGICLIPYIVIGLLLMIYNYVRFNDIFEFGQSYQLTAADQSNYGSILSRISFKKIGNGLIENLFAFHSPTETFPHLSFSSVIGNFPIVAISWICLFTKKVRNALTEKRLGGIIITLFLLPFLITCVEVLMSPWLLERYRSDIYWIFGIFVFLVFGLFLQYLNENERQKWSFFFAVMGWSTVIRAFLLWLIPWDFNLTKMCPEYLSIFEQIYKCGYVF